MYKRIIFLNIFFNQHYSQKELDIVKPTLSRCQYEKIFILEICVIKGKKVQGDGSCLRPRLEHDAARDIKCYFQNYSNTLFRENSLVFFFFFGPLVYIWKHYCLAIKFVSFSYNNFYKLTQSHLLNIQIEDMCHKTRASAVPVVAESEGNVCCQF